MKISIVAAMSENHVIGKNNTLPWYLPADLRHFKEITLGKPVIMGRKTYDSIGKPLPLRPNIIVSHNSNLVIPGCTVVHSLNSALTAANNSDEVMIIGGAKIYAAGLALATHLYLTIIHHYFEGDTFFPDWNADDWEILEQADFSADAVNPYPYSFVKLKRKAH